MRFFMVTCVALSPAFGVDDVPKAISEKSRRAAVAEWHALYSAKMKGFNEAIARGKALLVNPDTASDGEELIAVNEERLASLKKHPQACYPVKLMIDPAEGRVGPLEFEIVLVVETKANSTVVDMPFKNAIGESLIARYALVPPIKDAVIGKSYKQDGIWRSAGKASDVTVLQRVEVRPEEMPNAEKKK